MTEKPVEPDGSTQNLFDQDKKPPSNKEGPDRSEVE
jgi:hypothetical protein